MTTRSLETGPDGEWQANGPPHGNAAALVDFIIAGRRSIRAFRPDPVPQALLEHLLDIAGRAPSGTNMQPWTVYALAGEPKAALSRKLVRAHDEEPPTGRIPTYEYYPDPFFEPFLARRRKVGIDLYGVLGIARGETERMHAQHGRNLLFFDAPVGLIFTIHRDLKIGSWLDYGMFLENIMIAARGHGLETCPQAAFVPFHETIRSHLGIPAEQTLVCGMALGYADHSAPENRLHTERVPARAFTTFIGFASDEVTSPK